MKKILPFLLFISFYGFASKIEGINPSKTHSSIGEVLLLLEPQLSSTSQTSTTGFTVLFIDKTTDETDYEFDYKINGAATWTTITFGSFAGTGMRSVPLSYNPAPGVYNITARMRAVKVPVPFTTALLPSTEYSPYTPEYSFVFSNIEPPKPIIAGFTSLTETTTYLSWRPGGTNEQQYIIERSDLMGPYVVVASLPASKLNFTDSDLKHNTTYSYRIKACNQSGCSTYETGTVTTRNGTPIAPGRSSIGAIAASKIAINWTDQSLNETGFVLQRAGTDLVYRTITTLPANATSFVDGNLNPNTRYYYRIASQNSFAVSTFTDLGDATTFSGMPSNLGLATLSPNSVFLSWSDNTNDETGFDILRSDASLQYVQIGSVGMNVQNYIDNTVNDNTRYFYKVRANFGSFVSNSIEGDITTPKKQPNNPSNLVSNPIAHNKVDLIWKDNSNDEDGFEIERAEGKGFVFLIKLPANTISYIDTSAKQNTTYGYRVRAYSPAGKSGYATTTVDITTPFEPIATPINFTVLANTYNEIKLTWKDSAKNETSYVVEKSLDGKSFTSINLPANSTSYIDNAVVDNTSYTYRVFAKNSNTSSLKTSEVTVKTPLKPLNVPTVLIAKSISDNEITLTWQDNEGLETGFEIQRSKDGVNFTKIADVKTNIVSYLDANLDASTKYYYRVRAFNDKQLSIFSNITDATTLVTTSVSKEKLSDSIKVYPNPAQEKINVDYPIGTENVNLLSQFGALISTQSVDKNSTSTEVNLSGIPSGMYFITAVNKLNKITKKIIKN